MTGSELPSATVVAANALWAQAQGRSFAAALAALGIPVLVLKGPEMQARLFGTPAAYASSDLDVLVRASDRRRAHQALIDAGFRFDHSNSILWRVSGQAMYERGGFYVDLHWGVKAAHVPAFLFRDLGRELWRGATAGPSGMLEPRLEPLLVFLAIHAAGHDFARPEWREGVHAAARMRPDRAEVGRIARRSRSVGAVNAAVKNDATAPPFVLDGWVGGLAWVATKVARGRFLPDRLRRRAREMRGAWRLGVLPPRQHAIEAQVADGRFSVWGGVCPPDTWSEAMVDIWVAAAADLPAPTLVEVGTGSGALMITGACRLPDARVYGTDISWIACRNALANARGHGVDVAVFEGDLLDALPGQLRGRVDAVLAHLPTVTQSSFEELRPRPHAPTETFVGEGRDGLDVVRRLLGQAPGWLAPGGTLVITMDRWQWRSFAPEAEALGFRACDVHEPTASDALVVLERSGM